MIEIEPSLEKKEAPAHADRFEDTRTVFARIQQMSAGFKLNADVKHPLVLKLQKLRKELKPDTDGRLRPHWGYPDVRVSADSWGRALRIIDTVFTISGSLGFGIVIKESRETFLCICGEDVQIGIREKVARSRKARKETSAPISQSLEVAYDYNPTGMLILSIKNVYHGDIRVNWADNSQGRVEDQLKDFFGVVVQAAAVRKEIGMEREEKAKKEQEAERVRQDAMKKKQLEGERIGKLVADAENWQKAVLIRQFINARLTAQQEREPGSALSKDFQEWLEWASKIADTIDPL